jgi:adenylate cyclase
MAALCYVPRKTNAWMEDRLKEMAEATRLAQRALDLGRDDAVGLYGAAIAFSLVGDLDKAAAAIDRALLLNPNLGTAWLVSASTRARLGEPELAIEHAQRALRLSPLDPFCFVIYGAIAAAHFFSGRYEEAISWSEKSVQQWQYYTPGQRFLAASLALAGRTEEARKAIATLQLVVPAARVSDLKDWITLRRPQDAARLQEGLREAGLPE